MSFMNTATIFSIMNILKIFNILNIYILVQNNFFGNIKSQDDKNGNGSGKQLQLFGGQHIDK